MLSTRGWEPIYGVEGIARAFVRAARQLAENHGPQLRLVMLGNGSQAGLLRRIFQDSGMQEQVLMPGQIGQADLPRYYQMADLYLSASHSDGASISLLEALACGLPALVSDIPGNREWVTPGETGWWFPDGDVDTFTQAILDAVARHNQLPEMGRRARWLAELRADWKKNFMELEKAYRLAVIAYSLWLIAVSGWLFDNSHCGYRGERYSTQPLRGNMTSSQSSKLTLITAWIVVILCSMLPRILLQEIFGQSVLPDMQAIMALSVILIVLLASVAWEPLRRLWSFLILFAVLVAIQWLVYNRIDELPFYRTWLRNPSFNVFMLAEQSLNLMVTLVIIAALFLMGKKRKDFYLARGDINAPVEPVRWMGVKDGERWKKFGLILTLCISLGTLTFLVIAGRPPLDIVIQALPFLPAILLAAALNAFNEEVTYKAAFLSVLESPVGPRQALYMVAYFFGIMHFYGVPYGVVGVILATFLGWILAKSMQETRGVFWAWFIHFWQDVWILLLPGHWVNHSRRDG